MSQPLVELVNVSKSFHFTQGRQRSIKGFMQDWVNRFKEPSRQEQQIEVLKQVSFSVSQGEFVGIMGRNGVGKSTLLKIISGIYAPTSGKVKIHGRIVPLLELGAGFASDLSGYENIFLNAAILGYNRKKISERIDAIISFSELGDRIDMPVRNYSSGMTVRLGFSIAAHLDAPILLFDEVLAVGDIGFQKKCLQKIEQLHSAGRTIILVTHDPIQVEQFCSRCIFFESGRIVFDGSVREGAGLYTQTV